MALSEVPAPWQKQRRKHHTSRAAAGMKANLYLDLHILPKH
jgi:hypothetical protein